MKGWAALVGLVIAACAAVLGRALGAALGFATSIPIIAVLALGVWIAIAVWRHNPALGAGAAVVWILPGLMNADVGHALSLLASGAHITNAHVAEPATWRDHERVTFGDGELRTSLQELAAHVSKSGGGSRSHSQTYTCIATPIVPVGWQPARPIAIWALDADLHSEPFVRMTFHPTGKPDRDSDCAHAIDRATAKHQLAIDPAVIYVERVDSLSDPDALRTQGLAATIVPAIAWVIAIAVWL